MKKILITGAVLMTVPFVSFAQTTTATTATTATTSAATVSVDPGLVPGDFFYFLDNIGENLRLAFTFNKEKKAELHLQYANERVAEINAVLKNPNAKLADVASAKANFDKQISDATDIVKSEKQSGADVSGLALKLSEELDQSHNVLKQTLAEHQNEVSKAAAEIQSKIDAITASGTASTTRANELKGLTQALESITKDKMDTASEESNTDASVSEHQSALDEVMGKEVSAQNHLEQAMRLKAQLGEDANNLNNLASSSDKLIQDAQDAMNRGDFEAASMMSKEAAHSLEKVQEANKEMTHEATSSESSMMGGDSMMQNNNEGSSAADATEVKTSTQSQD